MIYTLQTLISQLGYGLSRIDAEIRQGTIEMIRKGGRTLYRLKSAPVPVMVEVSREPARIIGRHIDRKHW